MTDLEILQKMIANLRHPSCEERAEAELDEMSQRPDQQYFPAVELPLPPLEINTVEPFVFSPMSPPCSPYTNGTGGYFILGQEIQPVLDEVESASHEEVAGHDTIYSWQTENEE